MALSVALLVGLLISIKKYKYYQHRFERKSCMLRQLNMRIGVVDKEKRLLYIQAEPDVLARSEGVTHLDDLQELHSPDVTRVIEQMFSGQELEGPRNCKNGCDYYLAENGRATYFSRLPRRLFETEAVMWQSYDLYGLDTLKKELGRSHERSLFIANILKDILIVTDQNGIVTVFNKAASLFFNIAPDLACGQFLGKVLNEAVARHFDIDVEDILKQLSSHDFDNYHYAEAEPGKFAASQYDIRAQAIHNEEGVFIGSVFLLEDLSDQRLNSTRLLKERELLNLAAECTNSSMMRTNLADNSFEVTTNFADNWPFVNGERVADEEWLNKKHLQKYRQKRQEALDGNETTHLEVCSKIVSGKGERYFHIWFAKQTIDEQSYLLEAIQDVTDYVMQHKASDLLRELHDVILRSFTQTFAVKDVDDDYAYVLINDTAARHFSMPGHEVIGKTDSQIMVKEFADAIRLDDKEVWDLQTVKVYKETVPIEGKNRVFSITKTPVTSTLGRHLIVCTGFEITQLVEAQEEAKEHQAIIESLLAVLPCWLSVDTYDGEMKRIFDNANMPEYAEPVKDLAYSHRQIFSSFDKIKLDDPECYARHRLQVLESSQPAFFMEQGTDENSNRIALHTSIVKANCQRPIVVSTCYDVSAVKSTNDELKRSVQETQTIIDSMHLFEQCLCDIAVSSDTNKNIDVILKKFAKKAGADRASIFRINTENLVNCEFEWADQHVTSLRATMRNMRMEDILPAEIIKSIANYRPSVYNNRLVESNSHAMFIYGNADIKSVIVQGLYVDNKLLGWVSVDYLYADHQATTGDMRIVNDVCSLFRLAFERQLNSQILQKSQHLQNMLIQSFPVPLIVLNNNCDVADINPAACKAFGTTPEQSIGQACHSVVGISTMCKQTCPHHLAGQKRQPIIANMRLCGRDYQVASVPVFDKDGSVECINNYYIDITEINVAKEMLKEQAAKVEEAAKTKHSFFASLSHELRTPLNAIIGFSELLQMDTLEPEQRIEYTKYVSVAANSLLDLLNDVLDYAKLNSGKMVIAYTNTNVNDLTREVQILFTHQLKSKNLDSTFSVPDNMPLLKLDKQHIKQILFNFMSNAVKYTQEGSVNYAVTYTPNDKECTASLMFEVSDTGIGISEKALVTIFDPFVQDTVTRGTYAITGGTGLGLSICKRLAEQMGGELRLESSGGKGTRCTLELKNVEIVPIVKK